MSNKKIYVPCFIEVEECHLDTLGDIHAALNHKNGLVFYAERPIGLHFCLKANNKPTKE